MLAKPFGSYYATAHRTLGRLSEHEERRPSLLNLNQVHCINEATPSGLTFFSVMNSGAKEEKEDKKRPFVSVNCELDKKLGGGFC